MQLKLLFYLDSDGTTDDESEDDEYEAASNVGKGKKFHLRINLSNAVRTFPFVKSVTDLKLSNGFKSN